MKSLACQHLLPLSVARPAKKKTVFLPSCFLLYDRQTAVGNKTLYQDIVISPFFVSWGTSRIVFFLPFWGDFGPSAVTGLYIWLVPSVEKAQGFISCLR